MPEQRNSDTEARPDRRDMVVVVEVAAAVWGVLWLASQRLQLSIHVQLDASQRAMLLQSRPEQPGLYVL